MSRTPHNKIRMPRFRKTKPTWDELRSVKQCCEKYGKSKRFFYYHIGAGNLMKFAIGEHVCLHAEQVQQLMKAVGRTHRQVKKQ